MAADNNYCAYDSAEDDAALNDRYEKIPTPAEGEELESSDEEEEQVEEDDDITNTESDEEEEGGGEKPKEEERKLLDPDSDPYLNWDKISDSERHLNNIQLILLDDPDIQKLWQQQELEADNETASEEDMDESEEEEDGHLPKHSDEEDELDDILSSGDESDEPKRHSTEPPTPVDLDAEVGETESDDESEESDFSIKTDPEEEEEEEEPDEQPESKMEGELEEEEKKEEQENEINENEDVEKAKRYRKLPKDSDDSDLTEWETITEESEGEENVTKEEPVIKEEEIEPEEIVEVKPRTPDPYGHTELHTNIEHIEEFDDDFDNKLWRKYRPSGISSLDESDPDIGECDMEEHSIEKQKSRKLSVIMANKTGFAEKKQDRRRTSVVNRQNAGESENSNNIQQNKKNENSKKNESRNEHANKPRTKNDEYVINLDVYNHDNYPLCSTDESKNKNPHNTRKQVKQKNEKQKAKQKGGKKRKQLKTLNASYSRIHSWYKDISKKPETDYPSAEIPSYRVQARSRSIKERTIDLTMKKLLKQTFNAIEEIDRIKLRKEAEHHSRFILLELADNVVGEIEEIQQREAVRFAIDVLLDKWEGHVYERKKTLIEGQLETLSEKLVTNAIRKSTVEVANEEKVVSLVVRDALAVALNDIGKPQIRIHRKLNNMFSDYDFPEYDFNKGKSTKVKQKRHKPRKHLDVFLRERAKRLNLPFAGEINIANQQHKKKRKKSKIRLTEIDEILESKDNEGNDSEGNDHDAPNYAQQKKSSEDEITNEYQGPPLFMRPDHSGSESEAVLEDPLPEKEMLSVAGMRNVAHRTRRRSTAIEAWRTQDKKLMRELRSENKAWNDAVDMKEMIEENEEEEKDKNKDLNAMYAETTEEEDGENSGSENDNGVKLPDLAKIVDEAIINDQAPIIVVPVPVGKWRERFERPDSALGSDKESKVNRKATVAESPPSMVRKDTGISSTITLDDYDGELKTYVKEVLKGNTQEDHTSLELIPKLDKDQYLQDWLLNGVQGADGIRNTLNRIPTPPSQPNSHRVRKFHLKRPRTSDSTASVRDVVPIEEKIYGKIDRGRLNSAKSTRSNYERPESAVTCYTDRSSVHSQHENMSSASEILESDEETVKNLRNLGNKKYVKKNTKIKFTNEEQRRNESDAVKKMEKEHEMAAWNFYSRQRRELRLLQEVIEEHGRPQLLSDVILPEKDLNRKDREKIREKYAKNIQINGMFNDDEEELELLQLIARDSSSSDESDKENEKQNAPSVEPPSTPWRSIKGRPLTPDSADSDEELTKLKDRFYEEHQRKQNGVNKKPDRVWKEFLKKKSPALPPPPTIGWQPTPGLINWKNANADVRKQKRQQKSEAELTANVNRNLFNQLQIAVKRDEKAEKVSSNRLLERRKTLHTENIGLTVKEKREKILPKGTNLSPRSSRSIPSYLKTTKASQLRKQDVKLPKIPSDSTEKKKAKTKSAGPSKSKSNKTKR